MARHGDCCRVIVLDKRLPHPGDGYGARDGVLRRFSHGVGRGRTGRRCITPEGMRPPRSLPSSARTRRRSHPSRGVRRTSSPSSLSSCASLGSASWIVFSPDGAALPRRFPGVRRQRRELVVRLGALVAGELGGEPCVLLHLIRRASHCVCCALLEGEYAAQEDKAVDDLGRDVDDGIEGVGSRV